jgi:hypothetical protein
LSLFFFILFPRKKLTKRPRGEVERYVSDKIEKEREDILMASPISISAQKTARAKRLSPPIKVSALPGKARKHYSMRDIRKTL